MRKMMSMLLALVMLLTPVLGFAASPAELLDQAWQAGCTLTTQVSFEMGDLPIPEEAQTVLNDLVTALGLRTAAMPEGKVEAALTLQGQDALAFGVEPVGDDVFIHLPLVTLQTMAFNPDEALVALERLVKLALEASGMSESEMAQLESAFTTGVEQGLTMAESAVMDEFVMPEIDTDALLQMLMNRAVMTEAPVQPADCDPVTSGVTINITPEIVEALMQIFCDILELNPSLVQALEQADMTIDPQALKEAPAAAAEEFKSEVGVIPVNILLDDAGNVAYVDVVITPVDGSGNASVSYARQTKEDGWYHSVNILESGNGVCLLMMDKCAENKTEYGFAVYNLVGGQKSGVLFDSGFTQTRDRNDQKAHDVTTLFAIIPTGDSAPASVTVALTIDQQAEVLGNGVKCDTAVKVNCDLLGGDVFTVHVNTVADDTQLPSIVSDAAVRPGAMTEEEFAGFIEAVPNYALTTVFTALQKLPESVLTLMMGQ